MKRASRLVIFAVLVFWLVPALPAGAFGLDVKSAMLMDLTTGRLLYEQDADRPIPPASVTKILTMYMVLEAIKDGKVHPWDEVRISRKADATGGSKMFVKAGDKVQLKELFKGMAISSGNDACVAVAEHMAGTPDEFVRRMNMRAQSLGMTNTMFRNPNGLPAKGQLTTARDMMKLSTNYLRRFPEALSVHSMKVYTHNRVTTHNRNRLLGTCDGVDGLKTGFVSASGYNIVATAKRGKTRLVAVVMGAPSATVRANETRKLLELGFEMVTHDAPAIIADRGWSEPVAAKAPPKSLKSRKGKALPKVAVAKADLKSSKKEALKTVEISRKAKEVKSTDAGSRKLRDRNQRASLL